MIKGCFLKNESGMALVVALVMMIVLTLIGLASTFTSTFEIMLSGEKRKSTNAFYAADGGANVIVLRYQNFVPGRTNYNPFTDPANSNPTNVEATVDFDPLKIGPQEGQSFNNDYAYFWLESRGDDGTGMATRSICIVNLNVQRILARPDSITEDVVN
jgi:Tfp pilus assembly protein PilX